ncbi:thiamine phosphate synthase [uncultured Desulfuromonas sp.]|uniref:thiamine phosphate synthase n=1 Tax=uncultured Desulfuromonas sp. TaxID=181013 RepID=UPI00374DB31D
MAVDFSLYLISDRRQTGGRDLLDVIEAALHGGVQAVQLREKDLSSRELYTLGCALRELTRRYQARLLINDRIDIALAVDADGVHLTEQSLEVGVARQLLGPDKLIGVSTHHVDRAVAVEQQGADFITFSPIYATPSKAAYGAPQGLDKLRNLCRQVSLPVIALGGINAQRRQAVLAAGATGCAVISAILAANDPCQAAKALRS